MSSQTVFSKDIFHGLPTFPEHDGKKLTAIGKSFYLGYRLSQWDGFFYSEAD